MESVKLRKYTEIVRDTVRVRVAAAPRGSGQEIDETQDSLRGWSDTHSEGTEAWCTSALGRSIWTLLSSASGHSQYSLPGIRIPRLRFSLWNLNYVQIVPANLHSVPAW
eukprot:SAG11_NODE_11544_length_753_cov_2.152905_1_plen_109_part_00